MLRDTGLGPIVRVSPNEISFASVASWKDIYGHKSAGKQTPVKSEFYEIYGSGFNSLCIGSERDPQKHSQMKASLSAAFSTKALQEQEHIVSEVVDAFIARIGEQCGGVGINMTKWYEMVAFDILGEMAFGNSFHSIQDGWFLSGKLPVDVMKLIAAIGKPHFWSELIVGHLFFITVADNIRRLHLGPLVGMLVAPFTGAIRNKHTNYTREQVTRYASIRIIHSKAKTG